MTKRAQISGTANVLFAAALCWLVLAPSLCRANFHYEAPSDCQWTLMNSSMSQPPSPAMNPAVAESGSGAASAAHPGALPGPNDVALHCRLRTINSQFDQTNFSVVPREHTASLTIECSDSLLYQRYIHYTRLYLCSNIRLNVYPFGCLLYDGNNVNTTTKIDDNDSC